jgi:hypothetical protein
VVVGNAYLLTMALEKSERMQGKTTAIMVAQEEFRRGHRNRRGGVPSTRAHRTYDDGALDICLVGPSVNTVPSTMEGIFNHGVEMRAWVLAIIREESGEPDLVEEDVRCFVFERCSIYGEEITSIAYTRARTRVSYNVTLIARDEDRRSSSRAAACDDIVGCVHRYFMAIGVDDNRVLARFALVTKFKDDTTAVERALGLRAITRWGEAIVPLKDFLAKCMVHVVKPKRNAGSTGRIYSVPLWGLVPTSSYTSTRPF